MNLMPKTKQNDELCNKEINDVISKIKDIRKMHHFNGDSRPRIDRVIDDLNYCLNKIQKYQDAIL